MDSQPRTDVARLRRNLVVLLLAMAARPQDWDMRADVEWNTKPIPDWWQYTCTCGCFAQSEHKAYPAPKCPNPNCTNVKPMMEHRPGKR